MEDLASEFDVAWKEALEWFFEPFLAYFFPDLHAAIDWSREPEFMDKELQQIAPEAETGRGTVDKLVKLWTKEGAETWVFVHVEVQSQHDTGFARRLYVYNHRLEDRYGQMPVSLAVLGDDGPEWRPEKYEAGRWRCNVQFVFPVIKLLDYRSREGELEAEGNPFAAVVLAHLKTIETRGNPSLRYDWKLRLYKGLHDRGFNKLQTQRLFNVMDWVMKLPPIEKARFKSDLDTFDEERQVQRLSPTLQDFHDEGITQGLRRAIELGLRRRFGQQGLDLLPRVKSIMDISTLENLIDTVATAPDLESLQRLLPPQA